MSARSAQDFQQSQMSVVFGLKYSKDVHSQNQHISSSEGIPRASVQMIWGDAVYWNKTSLFTQEIQTTTAS